MSYYNNAPRECTPVVFNAGTTNASVFKTNKLNAPVATDLPADAPLPEVLNTCHRSRLDHLQATHPYTYARLREVEKRKALQETREVQ